MPLNLANLDREYEAATAKPAVRSSRMTGPGLDTAALDAEYETNPPRSTPNAPRPPAFGPRLKRANRQFRELSGQPMDLGSAKMIMAGLKAGRPEEEIDQIIRQQAATRREARGWAEQAQSAAGAGPILPAYDIARSITERLDQAGQAILGNRGGIPAGTDPAGNVTRPGPNPLVPDEERPEPRRPLTEAVFGGPESDRELNQLLEEEGIQPGQVSTVVTELGKMALDPVNLAGLGSVKLAGKLAPALGKLAGPAGRALVKRFPKLAGAVERGASSVERVAPGAAKGARHGAEFMAGVEAANAALDPAAELNPAGVAVGALGGGLAGALAGRIARRGTSNIQHPTSNVEPKAGVKEAAASGPVKTTITKEFADRTETTIVEPKPLKSVPGGVEAEGGGQKAVGGGGVPSGEDVKIKAANTGISAKRVTDPNRPSAGVANAGDITSPGSSTGQTTGESSAKTGQPTPAGIAADTPVKAAENKYISRFEEVKKKTTDVPPGVEWGQWRVKVGGGKYRAGEPMQMEGYILRKKGGLAEVYSPDGHNGKPYGNNHRVSAIEFVPEVRVVEREWSRQELRREQQAFADTAKANGLVRGRPSRTDWSPEGWEGIWAAVRKHGAVWEASDRSEAIYIRFWADNGMPQQIRLSRHEPVYEASKRAAQVGEVKDLEIVMDQRKREPSPDYIPATEEVLSRAANEPAPIADRMRVRSADAQRAAWLSGEGQSKIQKPETKIEPARPEKGRSGNGQEQVDAGVRRGNDAGAGPADERRGSKANDEVGRAADAGNDGPGGRRPDDGPGRSREGQEAGGAVGGALRNLGGKRMEYRVGARTFTIDTIADANNPKKVFVTGLTSTGKGGTLKDAAPQVAEDLRKQGYNELDFRADNEDGRGAARQRMFEPLRQAFAASDLQSKIEAAGAVGESQAAISGPTFSVGDRVAWTAGKRTLMGTVGRSSTGIINGQGVQQYIVGQGKRKFAVSEDRLTRAEGVRAEGGKQKAEGAGESMGAALEAAVKATGSKPAPAKTGIARAKQSLAERKEAVRKRIAARAMEQAGGLKAVQGQFKDTGGPWRDVKAVAENLGDLAEYVAIRIAEGALNKAEILKGVMTEFGAGLRPHLERVWTEGQRYYVRNRRELRAAAKITPETMPDEDFVLPKEIGVGRRAMRLVTSGDRELRRQGAAGTRLAGDLNAQRKQEAMLAGEWTNKLEDAMAGLSAKDRVLAGEVQEGIKTTGDPRVSRAVEKLNGLLNEIGERAELSTLEIRDPSGRTRAFRRRKNYFPRVYDFDTLTKAKHRTKILRHLVDTGQAKNLADADRQFMGFLKGTGERRAGNLEHARVLDVLGYEKDPLKAVGRYIEGAARRLTEADVFGKKDDIAKAVIEKVRREGGDWRYAQEVFDLMVGGKRHESRGVDLAAKFNVLTKLDWAILSNMAQPVNTAVKTGVVNTLDALLKTYVTDRAGSRRFARAAGATGSPMTQGRDVGITMGRVIETEMAPFQFVEERNRISAAVAGKRFAEKLARKLMKNPTNRYAIRQLKSLGIDVERVLAEGKLSPEDILGAGYETAKSTQFYMDALDLPPAWKTNVGRLVTQFRSFNFRQGNFVRDEVLKEARRGNLLPMVKLIALGVPASYLYQSVRNLFTGRSVTDDAKAIDVRRLDMYLKAVGTMPTDLITQGEFIYRTVRNPYVSPYKKVLRVASTVGGPTVGEGLKAVESAAAVETTKKANRDLPRGKKPGDPYLEIKRQAASWVPFVGEYVKNTAFAYPKDNVGDFARVVRGVEAGDRAAVSRALRRYDARGRTTILQNAAATLLEEAERNGDENLRRRALRFVPAGKRGKMMQRAKRAARE